MSIMKITQTRLIKILSESLFSIETTMRTGLAMEMSRKTILSLNAQTDSKGRAEPI